MQAKLLDDPLTDIENAHRGRARSVAPANVLVDVSGTQGHLHRVARDEAEPGAIEKPR